MKNDTQQVRRHISSSMSSCPGETYGKFMATDNARLSAGVPRDAEKKLILELETIIYVHLRIDGGVA